MPPDLRVGFFGDSLTAGLGDVTTLGWVGRVVASARRDGNDLTGYNLGVRGETGAQVHTRLQAEALPRLARGDGHGVVVSFGVNDTNVDGGQQRALEPDPLAALRQIAEQAEAAAWPLLVVGPTLVDDPDHNQRILGLSAAMAAGAPSSTSPGSSSLPTSTTTPGSPRCPLGTAPTPATAATND